MNLHKGRAIALALGLVAVATLAIAATSGDRLKSPVAIGQGIATTEKLFFDTGNGSGNATIQSDSSGNLSLPATGSFSVAGVLFGANGSVGAPEYSFTSESNTGMYHGSSHKLDFTVNGNLALDMDGSIAAFQGRVRSSGTTGAPGLSFTSQADMGINEASSTQMDLIVGGTPIESVTSTGVQVANGLTIVSGGLAVTGSATLNSTGGNTPHACVIRNITCNTATSCDLTCSAGETITGGGCNVGTAGVFLQESAPLSTTSWRCATQSTNNLSTFGVCCPT